jgi:hypothetical protein
MLFFLLLTKLALQSKIADAECDNINCTVGYNVACYGFELSSTSCPLNLPSDVYFYPTEPILFNSEFNSSIIKFKNVYLYTVNGLNVYPWSAFGPDNTAYDSLSLTFSTVEFYVNNTPPSAYTCSPGIIPNNSASIVTFFQDYVNELAFLYGNKYKAQAICPFVFANAKLEQLSLGFQVDTFLFTSLFRFQQTNNTKFFSINSTIQTLSITKSYNYKLDTGLLHPLVFERINFVQFFGQINFIQTDLFKYFKHLNTYIFKFNSLGNFYHQFGIEWMNYVAVNSTIFIKSQYINYTYPDRDICIFAQFPVNLNIQLFLDDHGPNASLAYTWLCEQTKMVSDLCVNLNAKKDSIKALIKLCDMNRNATDSSNGYSSYPDYYQTRLAEMLLMELVPFVFIPCACIFGLYLNWIIIRTIKKNEKTELKEDFYKYMSANAKFNCIYCLILVFYPMTSCTWRLSYHLCSTIFTSQFVQWYKIVMIAYFSEVIKMCANIMYLMMTLHRYLLVGTDHASWLVTVAKLDFKWVVRGSFLFGLLINIGHGWEYQPVERLANFDSNNLDSLYLSINGLSYSDYQQANQGTHYFVYSIVYFIINFGGFFFLNTGIEIKIVRRMHKELKEKRKRIAKMNSVNCSKTTSVHREIGISEFQNEDKKRETDDAKKERRVIKMVILNGIFNFILRAPDMLFWLENYMTWSVFNYQDTNALVKYVTPGILNFIADIGYLTYILTFSTNFLIFYKFNKNFNKFVVFCSFLKTNQSTNV